MFFKPLIVDLKGPQVSFDRQKLNRFIANIGWQLAETDELLYRLHFKAQLWTAPAWTRTRFTRRRLSAIGIMLIAVYGLAKLALNAEGWWLLAIFTGVLICTLAIAVLTFYLLMSLADVLTSLAKKLGYWMRPALMLVPTPVRRIVVSRMEKRRRRKEWEAQRQPSFLRPPAPFYLGD